jgi:radical SAM superfamily enzyme YgiQ (UPF0313 family)
MPALVGFQRRVARRRPLRVKMILPALLEANAPGYRPIKYALFPTLGLAGLAGYLNEDDEVELVDEHVQTLSIADEPDLVVMTVYITSAKRAYAIADQYRARGVHVCLGGLHPTSLPDEAALHADTVFIGPGEDTWPIFLRDYRSGVARQRYVSETRTLANVPPLRRDLIDRHRYLCPNSLVISRGCPHHCDFCYKDAFSKVADPSIPLPWMMHSQRLSGYPGGISISSTTTSSGTGASRRPSSTVCAAWVASFRAQAPSARSCKET